MTCGSESSPSSLLKNPSRHKRSGILGFSLLPKTPALRQTLSRRSKYVVQVVANRTKLRTEGEQNGAKQLYASCGNLLLFSGLRRLRQDLVNFISRLEGSCSIRLSYGRDPHHYKVFLPRIGSTDLR